ncbi:MAG TPA: hypothetical protein VFF75_12335 [Methylophilaceae bacterium]|nr:hypothetical protein [Methylophilaceae bacterium]
MSTSKFYIAVAAALMMASSVTFAGDSSGCKKDGTPEKIDGRITAVDTAQGKVTVQSSDGKTHVFQAAQETLKAYKVGDSIKMSLRCEK